MRLLQKLSRRIHGAITVVRSIISGSQTMGSITIYGPRPFRNHTYTALQLLQQLDITSYEFIQVHLGCICLGRSSGTFTTMSPPWCIFGHRVFELSAAEYAGYLVHEACHARLRMQRIGASPNRRERKLVGEEERKQEESTCLARQIETLGRLGVTQEHIAQIQQSLTTEYWKVPYHDRNW